MKQLIYISISNIEKKYKIKTLNEIARLASHENIRHNITGLLFSDNNKFLQFIEGPENELHRLYINIKLDPRHKNIKTIYYGDSIEPFFNDWSMKLVLYDNNFISKINTIYEILSNNQITLTGLDWIYIISAYSLNIDVVNDDTNFNLSSEIGLAPEKITYKSIISKLRQSITTDELQLYLDQSENKLDNLFKHICAEYLP